MMCCLHEAVCDVHIYGDCPYCGEIYELKPREDEEKAKLINYCYNCGQKLDWSNEDAE